MNLDVLKRALDPTPPPDPVRELAQVAKRKTRGDVRDIPLDGLQVELDYQRPPDRDKIKAIVARLEAGEDLAPIKVNERWDGSRWITDGQHRAIAHTIRGHDTIRAHITYLTPQDEAQDTQIVTKTSRDGQDELVDRLEAAGGEWVGKRLTLNLGHAGHVSYLPHAEDVGVVERGQLEAVSPLGGRIVLSRLGLTPESARVALW